MPLLAPHTFSFENRVEWTVRNFQVTPPWEEVHLISPEFDVRLLNVVPLRLYLQSQGQGEGWLFGVCSDEYIYEHHGASMEFEVRVQRGQVYRSQEMQVEPSKPPVTPSVRHVVLDCIDPAGMDLDEGGTLLLQVVMRTSLKQVPYCTKMFDRHMVSLSNDLVSMVADTLYHNSDCHMESKDGVSAMVHFCILKARVPCVFDFGTWHPREKKWDTGLSVEAQRTARFYLYGSLAVPVPEKQKEELTHFAKLYKLKDFESMLKPRVKEFSVGTTQLVDDVGFNFLTSDIAWVNAGPRKLSFALEKISTRELEVTLTTTPDGSIEFAFEFIGFEIACPIFMKGSIKLIDHSDKIVREHEICRVFKTKAWTTPPPQFVTRDLVAQLRLQMIVCKLQLSEGVFEPKEEVKEEAFEEAEEGDLLIFNDLEALGKELLKLYETDQDDCDLELHSEGEVFKVHRAIAVARSPKIREMVLQQELEEESGDPDEPLGIWLKDFPKRALQIVIQYIYSGRIKPDRSDNMREVMEVADYLQLHLLAEECGEA